MRHALDRRILVEQSLDGGLLDLGGGVLTLLLVGHLRGGVQSGAVLAADLREDALVDGPLRRLPLGLAALALQLELHVDELLDLVVGQAQRLDDDRLGDLIGAGLDHDDGVPGAGDHEVELRFVLDLGERGVDHELVLDAPDAHGPDRAEERDLAEAEGRRCAQGGEHVVVVLEVDGQHGGHHVDLVHVPLREQRPDRPVDLAGGERWPCRWAATRA